MKVVLEIFKEGNIKLRKKEGTNQRMPKSRHGMAFWRNRFL